MMKRPTYKFLEDGSALRWYGPAFACLFGTIAGSKLILSAGLPGWWFLIPPILAVAGIYFMYRTFQHTRARLRFYAEAELIDGTVIDLDLRRSDGELTIQYIIKDQSYEARKTLPIAVIELLRVGGTVPMLVDPDHPSQFEVIGPDVDSITNDSV